MKRLEEGIVRPLRNNGTPSLGPLAIIAATEGDYRNLKHSLRFPHMRKLYLSELSFDAAHPMAPALVGPLIGAPYAVMILETLAAWGVKKILFLGWCGTISPDLLCGDILVADSAVIDEGTSIHYGQSSGNIVHPDRNLHQTLRHRLRESRIVHTAGRVWSTDGIFRETPAQIEKFRAQGAVAVEMELSALCSAAPCCGISFAAVLIVSDELFSMQWRPGFNDKKFKQSRKKIADLLKNIFRSSNHD